MGRYRLRMGKRGRMSSSKWIEELIGEVQHRNQERAQRDALTLHRRTLLADQGPLFFEDLKAQVQRGCTEIARQHPEFASVAFDPQKATTFSVRNLDIRPQVKVSAHLHTVCVIILSETRESAVHSFSETPGRHRIDFGLDSNDQLSLCMNCEHLGIDDVAKLILRPAFGL